MIFFIKVLLNNCLRFFVVFIGIVFYGKICLKDIGLIIYFW